MKSLGNLLGLVFFLYFILEYDNIKGKGEYLFLFTSVMFSWNVKKDIYKSGIGDWLLLFVLISFFVFIANNHSVLKVITMIGYSFFPVYRILYRYIYPPN
jgi:F0F1-type ATP synthase membrane subunit a